MGLREKLNNNPAIAVAVFVIFTVAAVAGIAAQRSGSGSHTNKSFYSADDGVSWFVDDATKVPPFDHDGKQAVLAHVVDHGGQQSVAYLERYTPAKQKFMLAVEQATLDKKAPPNPPPNSGATNWGDEIKKPGDKDWIPASNLRLASTILGPYFSSTDSIPVTP